MKRIALLEGPENKNLPGFWHVIVINPNYFPGDKRFMSVTNSTAAGMVHFAERLNCVRYPVGTWEQWPHDGVIMPPIRPDVLAAITGQNQAELAV